MAPLLLTIGSLSLGEICRFLMVLLPLKWVCMPYLPQNLFDTFTKTLCIRYNTVFNFIGSRLGTCSALVVSLIRNLTGGLLSIFSTLSKVYLGYLLWISAFPRWAFSLQRSSGLLHTVWVIWVRCG